MRKKEFRLGWIVAIPIFVLALVFGISVSGFSVGDEAGIKKASVADVQIIENKAKPSGSEKLILTKEITVGKLEKGGSIFNGLGGNFFGKLEKGGSIFNGLGGADVSS
ncbi:MAG TPA: hypothetical protein PKH53_09015, partial [Candidatus Saccharicenans sp.]|nr:hypothetical protein [Candidatus Saccharicenans sp.]